MYKILRQYDCITSTSQSGHSYQHPAENPYILLVMLALFCTTLCGSVYNATVCIRRESVPELVFQVNTGTGLRIPMYGYFAKHDMSFPIRL